MKLLTRVICVLTSLLTNSFMYPAAEPVAVRETRPHESRPRAEPREAEVARQERERERAQREQRQPQQPRREGAAEGQQPQPVSVRTEEAVVPVTQQVPTPTPVVGPLGPGEVRVEPRAPSAPGGDAFNTWRRNWEDFTDPGSRGIFGFGGRAAGRLHQIATPELKMAAVANRIRNAAVELQNLPIADQITAWGMMHKTLMEVGGGLSPVSMTWPLDARQAYSNNLTNISKRATDAIVNANYGAHAEEMVATHDRLVRAIDASDFSSALKDTLRRNAGQAAAERLKTATIAGATPFDQISNWADVYKNIGQLPNARALRDMVTNRIVDIIRTTNYGANLDAVLTSLESSRGALNQLDLLLVTKFSGRDSASDLQTLRDAIARKISGVLAADNSLNALTLKDFQAAEKRAVEAMKSLTSNREILNLAHEKINNIYLEKIKSSRLNSDNLSDVTSLIQLYQRLKSASADAAFREELKKAINAKINEFVNSLEAHGLVSEHFDTLLRLLTILEPHKEDIAVDVMGNINSKIDGLVRREIDEHTTLVELLKANEAKRPPMPIADVAIAAYQKELNMLNTYVPTLTGRSINPSLRLALAKRILRLQGFIAAHKSALGRFVERINSIIGGVGKPEDIIAQAGDSDFIKRHKDQLSSMGSQDYLPEDKVVARQLEQQRRLDQLKRAEAAANRSEFVRIAREMFDQENINSALRDLIPDLNQRRNANQDAQALMKELNAAIAKDTAELSKLTATANTMVDDVLGRTTADLVSKKNEVAAMIQTLEERAANSLVSEAKLAEIRDTISRLEAVRSIQVIAEGDVTEEGRRRPGLLDITKPSGNAQDAYVLLVQNVPAILRALDYRITQDFTQRNILMDLQQKSLSAVARMMNEQKLTYQNRSYAISDLADELSALVDRQSTRVSLQTRGALEQAGFLRQNEQGIFVPTEKGLAILEIYREMNDVQRRIDQLQQFRQDNSNTPPQAVMKNAQGQDIPLTRELKLGWMIPDDQIQAMQSHYLRSLRDPLTMTANAINDMQPVDSFAAAMRNVATTLGITTAQAGDPREVAKKITKRVGGRDVVGLTDSEINDADRLAEVLNIFREEEKRKLQTDAGRLEALQRVAVEQKLARDLAAQSRAADSEPQAVRQKANRQMLNDISDVLDVVRRQREESVEKKRRADQPISAYEVEPINPYFEALVELRRGTQERAQALGDTAMEQVAQQVLNLMGAHDMRSALEVKPLQLKEQMWASLTEMGILIMDGMRNAWLGVKLSAVKARQFFSKIFIWGAPVVGIGVGVITASQLKPAISALVGIAGSPIAGLVTYVAWPKMADHIAGILAGSAAAVAVYWAGKQIEPSREQLEALNKQLLAQGYNQITIPEGKNFLQASKEWVKNLFQTNMKMWTQQAAIKKSKIDKKVKIALEARDAYYRLLGLAPSATFTELQAAQIRMRAQMDVTWGPKSWLMNRSYKKALRYMIRAHADIVTGHIDYLTTLQNMINQALAQPAARNEQHLVVYGWNRLTGTVGDIFRSLLGRPKVAARTALTPEGFATFKSQAQEFVGRQISDLGAIKDMLDQQPGLLRDAIPDVSYINQFKSLIDGRITSLQSDYASSLVALLREHGFSTSAVAGAGAAVAAPAAAA